MLGELLNRGFPALLFFGIIGVAIAFPPPIALVLFLQRFERLELVSGGGES